LHIDDNDLHLEDLYSLNGTFLKLHDEVLLTPGDSFLMGQQVLRFERFEQSITPKTKSSDGTRYMGSPAPGGSYKILQIGIGNVVQNVYCLPESGAVLGREKGDIIFPHDKFMSSRHAQIYTAEDGQCYLVDLNSSNGTWTKLWEKTQIGGGDYIFMGQQLFRVHVGEKK
jgi:pSer/pThr/pTyr-binding forkhead associated (FHA) protein